MLQRLQKAWHRWDIAQRVGRFGWTGIYVGDYRSSPAWAYTVGFRKTLGAPEIVVFDLPRRSANHLFHLLFESLQSGELVLADGDLWGEGDAPKACWRRVHPDRFEDAENPWLGLAQTFDALLREGGGDIEAYQLVLPDPQGCFPWDAGYDERLRERQRELYLPAERQHSPRCDG